MKPPTSKRRYRLRQPFGACVLIVTLLLVVLAFSHVGALVQEALRRVGTAGPWGPVLFVLFYVLATVFFVPGSVLTVGAGALYGVIWGSALVSLGSTIGAVCSFLAGRYLARGVLIRRFEGDARFDAIDRAVARDGWKIVGLARLSPIFPFTLLNYAMGLTGVRLRTYLWASWVGMIPGTVMYVYLGSIAQKAVGREAHTPSEMVFWGVGLVATLAVSIILSRLAGRVLSRRMAELRRTPVR